MDFASDRENLYDRQDFHGIEAFGSNEMNYFILYLGS